MVNPGPVSAHLGVLELVDEQPSKPEPGTQDTLAKGCTYPPPQSANLVYLSDNDCPIYGAIEHGNEWDKPCPYGHLNPEH
jgi:hypothetical protein